MSLATQTGASVPNAETAPGSTEAPAETPVATPRPPVPEPMHHHAHHHHTLLQAFQSLVYVIVVALFIITFIVQPFRIPSASMEPTLLVGDFLLVNKQIGLEVPPEVYAHAGHIERGDLIVFHYPVDPTQHLVKRVIGLPGDHLRLRDGHVILNGQPLNEPYAYFFPTAPDLYRDDFPHVSSADPDVESDWWIQMHKLLANGELTIPPNSYFVLGDNRNDSKDSRYWGLVPRDAIVGKPFLIYFSLNTLFASPGQPPATALSGDAPHSEPASGSSTPHFARWDRILRIIR